MSQIMGNSDHIKNIAKETLEVFSAISDKADKELSKYSSTEGGASALAYVNTMTGSERGINNLNRITEKNRSDLLDLMSQPAYARVKVSDEEGQIYIFYIARRTGLAIEHEAKLVSYLHPIGRLASLPVGEEEEIEFKGQMQYFEVLEAAKYQPIHKKEYWDSEPTTFRSDSGTFTVESLRNLLKGKSEEEADAILAAIMEDHPGEAEIFEGLRHEVRTAMALRDQPILDKFQDEIFRLPINSQLLIVGPPGTGKTTTLIRRLGQKLTLEALAANERALVIQGENDFQEHQNSWLMFTPTDLLKHFVKEAFNREQVPVSATDERIKTWETYRGNLARRVLGVLQATDTKGKFIYKPNVTFISNEILINPVPWYEHIRNFHNEGCIP